MSGTGIRDNGIFAATVMIWLPHQCRNQKQKETASRSFGPLIVSGARYQRQLAIGRYFKDLLTTQVWKSQIRNQHPSPFEHLLLVAQCGKQK